MDEKTPGKITTLPYKGGAVKKTMPSNGSGKVTTLPYKGTPVTKAPVKMGTPMMPGKTVWEPKKAAVAKKAEAAKKMAALKDARKAGY